MSISGPSAYKPASAFGLETGVSGTGNGTTTSTPTSTTTSASTAPLAQDNYVSGSTTAPGGTAQGSGSTGSVNQEMDHIIIEMLMLIEDMLKDLLNQNSTGSSGGQSASGTSAGGYPSGNGSSGTGTSGTGTNGTGTNGTSTNGSATGSSGSGSGGTSSGSGSPSALGGSSTLSSSAPSEVQQYKSAIDAASAKYGVPADLIGAEIEQESSGDPNAKSTNPALGLPDEGLMQVDTNTYSQDIQKYDPSLTGSNLFDPTTNIMAGTAYLAEQYKNTGSWSQALQNYNGGYDSSYVQEALQHMNAMGDSSMNTAL